MSRSTQYIGLTQKAKDYVKTHAIKKEKIIVCQGMFDEPVYGNRYHFPPPAGPNKGLYYTEIPQETPWSSGPMIFTYLKGTLIKEGGEELSYGYIFEWIHNPELKEIHIEYDIDNGEFWV